MKEEDPVNGCVECGKQLNEEEAYLGYASLDSHVPLLS